MKKPPPTMPRASRPDTIAAGVSFSLDMAASPQRRMRQPWPLSIGGPVFGERPVAAGPAEREQPAGRGEGGAAAPFVDPLHQSRLRQARDLSNLIQDGPE